MLCGLWLVLFQQGVFGEPKACIYCCCSEVKGAVDSHCPCNSTTNTPLNFVVIINDVGV